MVEKACSYYVRWVYSALADLEHDYEVPYLTSVRRLPSQQQQQLLLAPSLFHCLWNSKELTQRSRLASFISTEQLRAGFPTLSSPSNWSAAGDYTIGEDHFNQTEADSSLPPIVRSGRLLLDYGSPHALHHYPPEFGEVSATTGSRHDKLTKLVDALEAISATSVPAHKNLISHTQSFALVDTPAQPGRAIAMSTCELIGRMSILNLTSDEWTIEKLVNSVVHESIHSLIYKIELIHPLYTTRRDAWRLQVRSPWSGRVLYLHSFIHACFVWFGLCNYWQLARSLHPGWEPFFLSAQSGFLRESPAKLLSQEARRCIQPLVLEQIDIMSGIINSRY